MILYLKFLNDYILNIMRYVPFFMLNLYTDFYWNQTYAPYTLKIGEQTGKMHQGQSIVRHSQLKRLMSSIYRTESMEIFRYQLKLPRQQVLRMM